MALSPAAAAALLLVGRGILRPLPAGEHLIECFDYASAYDVYYGALEAREHDAGDYARAAETLRASLRCRPALVDELGRRRRARDAYEGNLASLYLIVYGRLGEDLERAGQAGAAAECARRVRALEAALGAGPG
jgi:hypothetical protein